MQREDELALVVEEQRGRVALSQTELAQSHIEVDALRTKLAESAAQRLGVAELLMAGVAATPLKSPPKPWRHRSGGAPSRRLTKEEAVRLGEHLRAGRS